MIGAIGMLADVAIFICVCYATCMRQSQTK